jgi:hypothetical protein
MIKILLLVLYQLLKGNDFSLQYQIMILNFSLFSNMRKFIIY